MNIVSLQNINFAYRKKEPILKDINIGVPQGSIYGFLGPNGAGKSTTLRLVLSLLRPSSGSIEMFGQNIKDTHPDHLSKVGSLIESASLYDHLSASAHLKISAKYYNQSTDIIPSLLTKVKLDHTGSKHTKDFSTGMKQRLGLALALLHDPELLILDEPTNGLDPNGIIELRNILHQLQQEGKTILLSSHILSEVEKIVDHLGIISNGKIVFEGTLATLQTLRGQNQEVKFRVSNTSSCTTILDNMEVRVEDDNRFILKPHDRTEVATVIKLLVEGGVEVFEVVPTSNDLENMFLNVTQS